MGVKELWSILSPAKREVSLDTLKGHTIAVDLSVWICENQGVKAVQGKVSKPHLRNLFFRIYNLIQLGITLVFVVDGDPPELKWETISSRISSRYGGRGRGSTKKNQNVKPGRSHFKSQIKECLELLDCLGVPYVQSTGEAEALCALLNQEGIVDGCITEDGDVFLYGATTVYKNFNLTGKNPVIDCYKMADIERQLGLTRETLVALALLLGCDYVPKGVPGVGKVHALQLVSQFHGSNILNRFKQWADRNVEFQMSLPSKPAHCTRCHHIGSAQKHKTEGCPLCGGTLSCISGKNRLSCTCDWHRQKEEFDKSASERDIMLKAMQVPGFPQEDVIEEFFNIKDRCPQHPLRFARPEMIKIMKFALDKLEWPEKYTRDKVIDLVVYHDLQNPKEERGGKDNLDVDTIVKRRVRNGIPCVEVLWKVPDAWKLEEDESDVISTIENFDLFKSSFPDLVEEFECTEASKRENKKGKKKKRAIVPSAEVALSEDTDILATVTDQLSGLSLHKRDAKSSSDGKSPLQHTTVKILGRHSCDSSPSPKIMDDDVSKKEFHMRKEKVDEVCSLSSLSHCTTSQQVHNLLEDNMMDKSESEGTQISTLGCSSLSRRDEIIEQCSILADAAAHGEEISNSMHQPFDDSIVLPLVERLDLKRRLKICEETGRRDSAERKKTESSPPHVTKELRSKFDPDESGGSRGKGRGKREVDLIKCKDEGKYEREVSMEQRNKLAQRPGHIANNTVQDLKIELEGKKLKQKLENMKLQNFSRVESKDCASSASGLSSSSAILCPELFDISTPHLSLVDGTSPIAITQCSIGQTKLAKGFRETSSETSLEVFDVSTPDVTLVGKKEPSGYGDSQEDTSGDSRKVEENLQICEEVYDLCTPDVSPKKSIDKWQGWECASTMRLRGETENGSSPLCSGSCDVIRAAKFSSHLHLERNIDRERDLKFSQEASVSLEPTELYDLCTSDVSTEGKRKKSGVTFMENGNCDVTKDDDVTDQERNCSQSGGDGSEEIHLNNRYPEEVGRWKGGGGGQKVMSTPDSSLWEEPTALTINTPSQTIARGMPSPKSNSDFPDREIEMHRHDSSYELQNSCQTKNCSSSPVIKSALECETFTSEERSAVLRENRRSSPAIDQDGSALFENSMDHSLFQNLNFSLGTSKWVFSPLTGRSGAEECTQFKEGSSKAEVNRKHLLKKSGFMEREEVDVSMHDDSCIDSVFVDEGLKWQKGGNVLTKGRLKGSYPNQKGIEGGGGKVQERTEGRKPESSSRKMVDEEVRSGCKQLLMDQPASVKSAFNIKGKKTFGGTNCASLEKRRGESMIGRGAERQAGGPCEGYQKERVLTVKNNHGNDDVYSKAPRSDKYQEGYSLGKDGRQSMVKQGLLKECVSQSCTLINEGKTQRNCSNDSRREIDPCVDKENSPVSLMDRLRKKSARTRDILKSMELD